MTDEQHRSFVVLRTFLSVVPARVAKDVVDVWDRSLVEVEDAKCNEMIEQHRGNIN